MKLAIMQPYFFPYIGYFQLIKSVDKILLYENVNFMLKNWMTRNRMLKINETPFFITIPVHSKSSFKKISEIELVNDERWKKALKKCLIYNYSRSSYFSDVFPKLEGIIDTEATDLHTYNSETIRLIARLLGINTQIENNNQKYLEMENELSRKYENSDTDESLEISQRKTERVILITKQEKANIFINAIGGTALYKKSEFADYGIDLYFIKTQDFTYKQFSKEFYPNLSILDVLLNCGIENTKKLLTNYDLI